MSKILRASLQTLAYVLGAALLGGYIFVGAFQFPALMTGSIVGGLICLIFWAVYTTIPVKKPKPKKAKRWATTKRSTSELGDPQVGFTTHGEPVYRKPNGTSYIPPVHVRVQNGVAQFSRSIDGPWTDTPQVGEVTYKAPEHKAWHSIVDGPDGSTRLCADCFGVFPDKESQKAIYKKIAAEILADLAALDDDPKEEANA